MKTIMVTLCMVTFSFLSVNAQEDTRLGAMLAYGTEIENIGIGANAEFPIMENLTISPSFIYYLPKKEYKELNPKLKMYNIKNEYDEKF